MSALHDAALIALLDLAADAEHDDDGSLSDEGAATLQSLLDVVEGLESGDGADHDDHDGRLIESANTEHTLDLLVSLSPAQAAISLVEGHGPDLARELSCALLEASPAMLASLAEEAARLPEGEASSLLTTYLGRETAAEVGDALLEAGFSGRKQDSAGRTRCYDDGKQVSCASPRDEMGQPVHRDEHARAAHEHVGRLLSSPASATPADIARTAEFLRHLTVAEAKQIQQAHGLQAGGRKAQLADRIAAEAAKVVKERKAWGRKARAANVQPAALFQTARVMHDLAREYQQSVKRMLAEARSLYRSETGKTLTRNHPAFRGGDHAGIDGLDSVARTMAGRYPELLGAHGYGMAADDESAAPRLYDMLSAGTPAVPRRSEAYARALDHLSEQASLFGRNRGAAPTDDSEAPF